MSLRSNFRSAIRQLAAHPAFTIAAVASLALGIGGNAAVFSVMDAVLLRSMPVERPNDLFALVPDNPRPQRYSYPLWQRMQQSAPNRPLAAMTRIARVRGILRPGGTLEKVEAQLVSGNFFSTLG